MNPHVMSKYANELDCLKARDKWSVDRILALEAQVKMLREALDYQYTVYGLAKIGITALTITDPLDALAKYRAEVIEECAKACEELGQLIHGIGREDSEAFDCSDAVRGLHETS